MKIRFSRPVSFNIDNDLRMLDMIFDDNIPILHPELSVGVDDLVRIYVLNPEGVPLIIFNDVPYGYFVGQWQPDFPERFNWPGFPGLRLAALKGERCISSGLIPVQLLVNMCIDLAPYAVMRPCDPDGRNDDLLRSVFGLQKPQQADRG